MRAPQHAVLVKTVDLLYFNAGGGHRATALALASVMAGQRRPWQVRLVDLARVIDPRSNFRRVAGFDPEQLYNKRLQHGWTLGLGQELKLLQAGIRWAHEALLRALVQHWQDTGPDLVVSLVPNFNRVLCESVARARPGVPFVTVMTDMADHPPHFWVEPDARQVVVCGTERALAQARAVGHPVQRLVRSSGMVIHPDFYRPPPTAAQRAAARRQLGLHPSVPTAIVMFGGHGSSEMLRIATRLDDLQLILLAGRNQPLAQRLRALERRAPHAVFGFTEDVAGLMGLADCFIGKPGPACLSEAVRTGLPVITLRNAWTMPQERYNTEWVQQEGVGRVVASWSALPSAVAEVVASLDRFRAATARLDNRAVFEVPALIDTLLSGDRSLAA